MDLGSVETAWTDSERSISRRIAESDDAEGDHIIGDLEDLAETVVAFLEGIERSPSGTDAQSSTSQKEVLSTGTTVSLPVSRSLLEGGCSTDDDRDCVLGFGKVDVGMDLGESFTGLLRTNNDKRPLTRVHSSGSSHTTFKDGVDVLVTDGLGGVELTHRTT